MHCFPTRRSSDLDLQRADGGERLPGVYQLRQYEQVRQYEVDMPAAARVADTTNHGGTIVGPGEPTVLIGGKPACVGGDKHVCALPPKTHQPTSSLFPMGSTTGPSGGKPAVRGRGG